MTAALYVLLSVMQYIFLFKKDVLCVTRVVQVLHLRLKHDDVKTDTNAIGVFIETSSAGVRQNRRLLFPKAYNRTLSIRSRATQIVRKI